MFYDSMKTKQAWQNKDSYYIYEIVKQFTYLDQIAKIINMSSKAWLWSKGERNISESLCFEKPKTKWKAYNQSLLLNIMLVLAFQQSLHPIYVNTRKYNSKTCLITCKVKCVIILLCIVNKCYIIEQIFIILFSHNPYYTQHKH